MGIGASAEALHWLKSPLRRPATDEPSPLLLDPEQTLVLPAPVTRLRLAREKVRLIKSLTNTCRSSEVPTVALAPG